MKKVLRKSMAMLLAGAMLCMVCMPAAAVNVTEDAIKLEVVRGEKTAGTGWGPSSLYASNKFTTTDDNGIIQLNATNKQLYNNMNYNNGIYGKFKLEFSYIMTGLAGVNFHIKTGSIKGEAVQFDTKPVDFRKDGKVYLNTASTTRNITGTAGVDYTVEYGTYTAGTEESPLTYSFDVEYDMMAHRCEIFLTDGTLTKKSGGQVVGGEGVSLGTYKLSDDGINIGALYINADAPVGIGDFRVTALADSTPITCSEANADGQIPLETTKLNLSYGQWLMTATATADNITVSKNGTPLTAEEYSIGYGMAVSAASTGVVDGSNPAVYCANPYITLTAPVANGDTYAITLRNLKDTYNRTVPEQTITLTGRANALQAITGREDLTINHEARTITGIKAGESLCAMLDAIVTGDSAATKVIYNQMGADVTSLAVDNGLFDGYYVVITNSDQSTVTYTFKESSAAYTYDFNNGNDGKLYKQATTLTGSALTGVLPGSQFSAGYPLDDGVTVEGETVYGTKAYSTTEAGSGIKSADDRAMAFVLNDFSLTTANASIFWQTYPTAAVGADRDGKVYGFSISMRSPAKTAHYQIRMKAGNQNGPNLPMAVQLTPWGSIISPNPANTDSTIDIGHFQSGQWVNVGIVVEESWPDSSATTETAKVKIYLNGEKVNEYTAAYDMGSRNTLGQYAFGLAQYLPANSSNVTETGYFDDMSTMELARYDAAPNGWDFPLTAKDSSIQVSNANSTLTVSAGYTAKQLIEQLNTNGMTGKVYAADQSAVLADGDSVAAGNWVVLSRDGHYKMYRVADTRTFELTAEAGGHDLVNGVCTVSMVDSSIKSGSLVVGLYTNNRLEMAKVVNLADWEGASDPGISFTITDAENQSLHAFVFDSLANIRPLVASQKW